MLGIKETATLASCMVLVLGTALAAAQQTSTSPQRKPGDLDEIRKVSALIGAEIMNHANTKIAHLRDLAFSPNGVASYAILGFNGIAGVDETYTAVPFDLLGARHDEGKWALNLDMRTEDLKMAPTIRSENYRELTDPQWIARVDQFIRAHGDLQHHPKRTTAAARENQTMEHVILATKLRSAALKNTQNQDLGKVEDLLLDRMNRVVFVIIGRGGVLGIGENYIPVPWSKLRLSENRENAAVAAVIDASKAQLEKAPLVRGDNYATLLAPGFAEQVRQYFGVAGHEAAAGGEQERQR